MSKKHLVILSGAGISAESGIATFRDANGLWEGHNVMDVASPEGWMKNRKLVLDFYNQRRKNALEVQPNTAHFILAELEKDFEVSVITQNVDDLHERAGSSNVIHLHGELFKSRSTLNPSLIYNIESWELNIGDKCEMGSQLRPHIVWFGEAVPMMETAITITESADIFVVVGTSLNVYPAASLISYAPKKAHKYIIDPSIPPISRSKKIHFIEEKATVGMNILKNILLTE